MSATLSSNPNPNPNPAMGESCVPRLLHVSLNQDSSCFATALSDGFRVYNCEPFGEVFRRESGGIGVVDMLFRSNYLAIVSGTGNEKVLIWDDNHSRCYAELSFRSTVLSVRLRRDRIVVVLLHKLFVYSLSDLKLLHQVDTIANPNGLCAVSHASGPMVMACPGLLNAQLRLDHYASKRTKFITPHRSSIASLALTQDGTLLATASTKGTLLRIFNTLNGSLLQEVRRGAERAEIYSLAFSSTAQWLAVSSDKGTVHVFNLKVVSGSMGQRVSPEATPSSISSLSFIRGVLPRYFSSEWSIAQFRLQEGLPYIVGFGQQKNTVVILGMDGSFHRCQFDPESGGEMTQLEYYNFLKPEDTI